MKNIVTVVNWSKYEPGEIIPDQIGCRVLVNGKLISETFDEGEVKDHLKMLLTELGIRKIDIDIKHWNYTCGDGCCSDSGLQLYLNNQKVGDEYFIMNPIEGHLIEIINFVKKEYNIDVELIIQDEDVRSSV